MGKIFNLDNPFFRFMERVADFFILNIFTILCSIPVFTAGAALTAHHKVMQGFVMGCEQSVAKSYFTAFAGNFRQATAVWLITAAAAALVAVDVFLVYMYLDGLALMLYMLLGVAGALILGAACYAFALIARYENTLREHLKNSLLLAAGNLPRTVLLVAVAVFVAALGVLFVLLSANTLLLWAAFGISLVIYVQTLILRPVFLMLEKAEEPQNEVPDL